MVSEIETSINGFGVQVNIEEDVEIDVEVSVQLSASIEILIQGALNCGVEEETIPEEETDCKI